MLLKTLISSTTDAQSRSIINNALYKLISIQRLTQNAFPWHWNVFSGFYRRGKYGHIIIKCRIGLVFCQMMRRSSNSAHWRKNYLNYAIFEISPFETLPEIMFYT